MSDLTAAREVAQAWRTLDAHAQASLRRGWPTLTLALDRLAAADAGHLTREHLRAISDRYRESPWDAPPDFYRSESV